MAGGEDILFVGVGCEDGDGVAPSLLYGYKIIRLGQDQMSLSA